MSIQSSVPKWASPDRQNALVRLFLSSKGFCVFGHSLCQVPDHHYYLYIECLISDWKRLDREQASIDWEAEQKAIHSLGERTYPLAGQFSAISREIFADNQPLYYLEGQAVSGLTLTPFVKVRLASSYLRLYIDLGEALRKVSKSKRRKAVRYGKPLPQEAKAIITKLVGQAVRDYLAH